MTDYHACIKPSGYTLSSAENARYNHASTGLGEYTTAHGIVASIQSNGNWPGTLNAHTVYIDVIAGDESYNWSSADSASMAFDNFTCTNGGKVVFRTLHGDEYTGASESWPDFANGWDTSAYRIVSDQGVAAGYGALWIDNDGAGELNLEIHGIQLQRDGTAEGKVVGINGGADHGTIIVNGCWLRSNNSQSGNDCLGGYDDSGATLYLTNCVFETGASASSSAEGLVVIGNDNLNVYASNNTITGFGGDAIELDGSGSEYVYNCAVFNNTRDFNNVANIYYCASDAGDDSGSDGIDWDNESTDWNANFTDYSSGDYTVVENSDIYQSGASLNTLNGVASTLSTLCAEDITGYSRPTGNDQISIGAFEYQSGAEGSNVPIMMHHYTKNLTP